MPFDAERPLDRDADLAAVVVRFFVVAIGSGYQCSGQIKREQWSPKRVLRGLGAAADIQLQWLRAQIAAGLIAILAFDDRAAEIAGALRAHMPIPPATAKTPKQRSKANSRVAWIMDLQSAATAFVHGYDLASTDAHHPLIAAKLNTLAPTAPPLLIQAPPRF
jgi:predicted nucleic acid-binding protein